MSTGKQSTRVYLSNPPVERPEPPLRHRFTPEARLAGAVPNLPVTRPHTLGNRSSGRAAVAPLAGVL